MKGQIVVGGGVRNYDIKTHDVPEPQEGCVLLRVRLANVCGSDIKLWQGGVVKTGFGTGHEFVGEICRLGAGVTTDSAGTAIKEGDRVVCAYYSTCGTCEPCLEKDYQNCENAYRYRDIHYEDYPYFHCAFASHYVAFPDQMFFKVPDELDDKLVAGVNCALSQSYGGIVKQLNVSRGEVLLVQGAGGLGLYATAIANEIGAKTIVIDGVKERLELARKFGASLVIDMNEVKALDERVELTRSFTHGKGADKGLEVCGVPSAFEEGLHHLKIRGRYAVMGINTADKTALFTPGLITRKAICVMGVVRYDPPIINDSLDFLVKTQKKYPYDCFCDEPFAMSEINYVMKQMENKKITRAALDPWK